MSRGPGRARRIGLRVAAVAAIQTAVLLGLAGMRQYTLVTGTHVLLATAPVDPRSLFQGDYVVLSYEIGRLDLTGRPATALPGPGEPIWAVLRPAVGPEEAGAGDGKPGAVATVRRVETERPEDLAADETAIRGTVDWIADNCGEAGPAPDRPADAVPCIEAFVTYGIETFFVPEGEGLALEAARERMTVEVAVDRFGTAAIAALHFGDQTIPVGGLF